MITLTWHLLVMIVITVLLLIGVFKEADGMDFTPVICILLLIALWGIYGGVFLW